MTRENCLKSWRNQKRFPRHESSRTLYPKLWCDQAVELSEENYNCMNQIIWLRGCDSKWKVNRNSSLLHLRSTAVLCDRERECKSQTIHLLITTSLRNMGFLKNWFARTRIARTDTAFLMILHHPAAGQERTTWYVVSSHGFWWRRQTAYSVVYDVLQACMGPTVYS